MAEPKKRQKGRETGSRMKQATMTPLILTALSLSHCLSQGFGNVPKIPLQDFPGMICGNVL